jgi:hypothetical protein
MAPHRDIQAAHEWLDAEDRRREAIRRYRRDQNAEYQRRVELRARYRRQVDEACGWSDYRPVHP